MSQPQQQQPRPVEQIVKTYTMKRYGFWYASAQRVLRKDQHNSPSMDGGSQARAHKKAVFGVPRSRSFTSGKERH